MYSARQLRDFWARVDRSNGGGDACWEWRGTRDQDGYGLKGLRRAGKRKIVKAHRMMWELTVSSVPDGLFVCHKCDNPGCVRPEHLFLGTAKDNAADMQSKGRQRYTGRPRKQPMAEAN